MNAPSATQSLDSQLLRDVFDTSPIGIAVEDLDGTPLFVNPALCAMLGFNDQELRDKHCVQISPPDDAAKDWALFQQLRASKLGIHGGDVVVSTVRTGEIWGLGLWPAVMTPAREAAAAARTSSSPG